MGSIPLKRVKGISKASVILIGATALMSFAELAARQAVTDEADDYLAGVTDSDEFTESIIGYATVGLVTGLLTIAAAVVTIIWMFRIAANHRALHRGGTWGPGWAIGGWFLPPLIYVIPTLMLREMWKASDPDVPVGSDWRRSRRVPVADRLVRALHRRAVHLVRLAKRAGCSTRSTARNARSPNASPATRPPTSW